MSAVDYWWEIENHPSKPPHFGALLAEVIRRRPVERQAPTLAIIGNYQRFRGSALHKIAQDTGLLNVANFSSVPAEQLSDPSVALLKWSPYAGHRISKRQRVRLPAGKRVLNDTHLDTDKSNVQRIWQKTAGYGTVIDPSHHRGRAVVKMEQNGTHSGRIVTLPVPSPEPGMVYEQVIDNAASEEMVYDLRVPFILGHPALAYVKFRSRHRRFENRNDRVRLVSAAEVLTLDEIDLCSRFCAAIGLDYGELDILRDGGSSRIYVVDVNNTPAGPPKGLTLADRGAAMRAIAMNLRRIVFGLAI